MDKNIRITAVMIVSVIALTVVSLLLNISNLNFGILPEFIEIQFSAVTELTAAIAFGPFVGIGVVAVKSFFYWWIAGNEPALVIGGMLSEIVFVVVASVVYHRLRGGIIKNEDKNGNEITKIVTRRRRIMISGMISTVIAAALSFFVIRYITAPWYIRVSDYTTPLFVEAYKSAVASVSDLTSAIARVNVPLLLLEYFVSTVVCSFIYKPLSYVMHGRFIR